MAGREHLCWIFAISALCVLVACSEERPLLQPLDAPGITVSCDDRDGDSLGVGCASGLDCNDEDPTIGSECLCLTQFSSGCACDAAGVVAECGTVYSRVGETVVCGQGVISCDGERWGQCQINNAVTLEKISAWTPHPKALGGPSACDTNPCDPGCRSFEDSPDGLELSPDDGLVSSEDGITLPAGQSIVVPGMGGSGFDCNDASYPAGGSCAHHICRIGEALDLWCDGTTPAEVPLSLFRDDFSAGNAQGWALEDSWEIGRAESSSGEDFGKPDPSTDTTDGSDDQIAGTVIGGNLGGTQVLFSDGFHNLDDWNETGEGDWTTEGWGNPVAHSDNCDTGCTLTLRDALDLSAYSAASLSFEWYLSTRLDSGEFLRVDAHDGSSWSTIFERSAEGHDDGNWHDASIDLSDYLVENFRLRFVTRQNQSNEHVRVDNVSISVPPAPVTHSLTSPAFDTSAALGAVTLTFKRWLNLNPDFVGRVEIFDGASWHELYRSHGAVVDSFWRSLSYDITSYKSATTRVRFVYSGSSSDRVSGWNIDDVEVTGTQMAAGSSLCVNRICETNPACCTDAWSLECVALLDDVCNVECAIDTGNDNACVACFNDPTLTVDVDGDGQSPATGDCRECDPGISSGAYDLPDNGIDENCDGEPDNEPVGCDAVLASDGNAWSHAKALGLCKVASDSSWGVIDASFVRADGVTPCTNSRQYAIKESFGDNNLPTEGERLAMFSSGAAREPGDYGHVEPDGNGYDARTSSSTKYPVPPAQGCSSGIAGYDSCGLKLVLRAPTNANSFAFNFNFFTSEFPEWLCTTYNDAFVAYYEGSLNTETNKNISFDSVGNPVSVNNGLFTVPGGWPPPAGGSHDQLDGTGFDGVCDNDPGGTWTQDSICGGSTNWLQTTAPVKPGEEITLIFNVWDTGDHKWDSTVLLDNFSWSTESANIQTGQYSAGPADGDAPGVYTEGWFSRDYDLTGVCGPTELNVWSLWSWQASTPSDSQIEFYVQAADSAAELDSAPRDTLTFSAPPGPSSLAGLPAVARAVGHDSQLGSTVVHDTLIARGRNAHANHLRLSARLLPSSDLLQAPVLANWNLQTSCQSAQ